MDEELPVDIFRRIVGFSVNSRTLLDLWDVNESAKEAIRKEIRKLSKKGPLKIDLCRFFREENPFQLEFFDFEQKEKKKELHDKIRELARLLERLLEIGVNFDLENLNSRALGFQAVIDEQYLPRAPFMLQKKMMHILEKFQSSTISISPIFMRPSRMIRSFRHRLDQITTLDLGNMKSLAACKLRSTVLPSLEKLENFTWNHANHSIIHKIPNKDQLKSLNLTFHIIGRPNFVEFQFLKDFRNLEALYFGFTVPHNPSRMEMDVLLNLYQAIWSRKHGNLLESYPKIRNLGFWNVPEKIFQQLSKRRLPLESLNFGSLDQSLTKLCSFDSVLQAFFKFEELENALDYPVVKHLNVSGKFEKLVENKTVQKSAKTLENQSEIVQNRRKTSKIIRKMIQKSVKMSLKQPENSQKSVKNVKNQSGKMNLHTMPAVGLDYYLPNLMNRINQYPGIQTISLLFKCIFHAQMTSSWSMETKKEKNSRRRPILDATYTEFKLHSEGLCGLLDLDRQLPQSLEKCEISLNLPAETGRKVIPSILDFIQKLGSLNDFPELVEFHIQILGVKCFEQLIHQIGEHLGPHLHRISIYAPLNCTDKSSAKRQMTRIAELFPRATEILLPVDFFRILMSESAQNSPNWHQKITKLARKHPFDMEKCRISTGFLPRGNAFMPKGEEPREMTQEEEEREIEELDESMIGNGGVEMIEDDDWIVDDDDDDGEEVEGDETNDFENTEIVYESEEDELDDLERKLEQESDRRHEKWQKKQKKRVILEDSEDDDDDVENKENLDDSHDVVDWNNLSEGEEDSDADDDDGNRNGLFDDQAVESDREESEDDVADEEAEDEEEPELESLDDSDDERLFENGPSRKRQIEQQQRNAKRRRIVISDDEEED
ncbi:hypothetical protein B9Z55_021202 [Caenorhabditis nigoni]|uniref:Uncharacterized protein n=1 Tax=Caenorhabditis nigoni TaxID=1611254 RepID=A0A2G5TQY4_9PELO|nr:hypothetical protein B9Z55_021202 [Caenorhabditis nigoni]